MRTLSLVFLGAFLMACAPAPQEAPEEPAAEPTPAAAARPEGATVVLEGPYATVTRFELQPGQAQSVHEGPDRSSGISKLQRSIRSSSPRRRNDGFSVGSTSRTPLTSTNLPATSPSNSSSSSWRSRLASHTNITIRVRANNLPLQIRKLPAQVCQLLVGLGRQPANLTLVEPQPAAVGADVHVVQVGMFA